VVSVLFISVEIKSYTFDGAKIDKNVESSKLSAKKIRNESKKDGGWQMAIRLGEAWPYFQITLG